MAIGEAATAFVFLFFGVFNQLPYLLAAVTFILNGLPASTLSNNAFSLAVGAGLATSCLTGIGNAMIWMAGAEAATNKAIYISLFVLTFLRVVTHSGMAVFVKRIIMRSKRTEVVANEFNYLYPFVSTRMGVFVGISWVLHVIEGVLAACIPRSTHLVNYTPFYFYIPGFVLHTAFVALVLYHLVYKAPRWVVKR